jgi:hypothetical protein
MIAAVSLLTNGGAWAQTAHKNSKAETANAQWRRLSQNEINCVDRSLRAHRSSVWNLIQQGISPSDPTVVAARSACRTPTSVQAQAQAQSQTKTKTQTPTPSAAGHTAMAAAEKAPSREYWTYEGSLLISIAEGASRKFHYLPPGQLTTADGEGLGAVIFEGKVSNNKYAGIAYSIDGRCGRMPYRAAGAAIDKPRGIELTGPKPRLDKNCKVTGTEPDTMTFELIDPAIAAAGETVSGQVPADKQAPADKAATEKMAAAKDTDQAAADKAAAPQAAEDKAVAVKAAAEKAAADKAAAEKAALEKAAADKAAADKIAAEKAAADNAASEKAAADKAAAEKAAAEKAAADIAAAVKLAKEKITVTTDKPAVEKSPLDVARAEADRAQAEAAKAQADAERARKDADKAIADAGFALASAESKISFIYGFITALALLGLAGAAFLAMQRMKARGWLAAKNVAPEPTGPKTQAEFDRLVAAVLDEQQRRERKPPKPDAPVRKPRVQEPAPL